MSDNRKYYYLKLKENYFDDDSIVLLESMQDGVLYSNILLKLYLKSLKHGGRLQLDEDIPYTAQMIATITRQQIGTVERALQIFLKLGLVEVLDSGTFYMSNIELLIGQSSTEAERKRAARLQNKALSAPRTNGGHLSDIRPPEIEIELEKEIEIKREIEKVRPETGHPSHTYGRYQNVFLTDEELADLQVSFPAVWEQYIEKLSEYMASTGKRYQSHAATIRRWAGEDAKKTVTPSRNRDYSVPGPERYTSKPTPAAVCGFIMQLQVCTDSLQLSFIKEKRLWNSLTLLSKSSRPSLLPSVPVSACGVLSIC